MPETPPPPLEYQVFDPERKEIRVFVVSPIRRRYWLHILLFLLTFLSTLCIGARLQYNFNNNQPAFATDTDMWPWLWALQDWHNLILGIPFSASLLGILTAHEFGHFILCVRRKVQATLPFFLPAPTLIGTFGAFIRIRSPIQSRKDLFDIGIAGPIAGFVVAIPLLFFSLLHSKALPPPTDASGDSIILGLPLIFKIAHWALAAMGSSAVTQYNLGKIYLHPVAVAVWFGMFATALNLLPGGQLDGGHIVYALRPRLHRPISLALIAVLLLLSWYMWAGWFLWAVILRLTGGRHPQVPPEPGLDRKRWWLGALALAMLALSMAPAPFRKASLPEAVHQIKRDWNAPSK